MISLTELIKKYFILINKFVQKNISDTKKLFTEIFYLILFILG